MSRLSTAVARFVAAAFVALAALPLSATPPDLVVVISIDQFRGDYLHRFAPWFGKGGFKRLEDEGESFPEAAQRYAITMTAVGHATIGTGLLPRDHGIVGNSWFDRIADREVGCVEDSRVRATPGSSAPVSPRMLSGQSLGDAVREADPASKVVGIALKDRSAILMAGAKATGAWWFDNDLPGFVTSTYYPLDDKILAFNAKVPSYVERNRLWEASGFIPPADLDRVTYDPPALRKFKSDADGMGVSFPHPITGIAALEASPFGDDLVLDFARHVIEAGSLGTADGHPDILFISLSSLDLYSHAFGPDSMEVADGIVRLDRKLASFLADLEARCGDRVTVVLTADHGVQSIPELSLSRGIDAGRLAFPNPPRGATRLRDLSPTRRALETAIARELRIKIDGDTPLERLPIRYAISSNLYLNWQRLGELGIDSERARQAAKRAVSKFNGVAGAWTLGELMATTKPSSDLERLVRASFHPDRSGDVYVALKPGWVWMSGVKGTSHGQPVPADMRVPLVFWGHGVKREVQPGDASPQDVARTVGAILGVRAGGDDSKLLPGVEVLDTIPASQAAR